MSTVVDVHAIVDVPPFDIQEEEERYERLGPYLLPADALLEIVSYVCNGPGDYATLAKLARSTQSFRRVVNDPLNDSLIWQEITAVPVKDQDGNPVMVEDEYGNLVPRFRSVPVVDPNWGHDQGLVTHKQVCRRLFLLDKIREEQGTGCSNIICSSDSGRVDNILITELGMDQCQDFLIQILSDFYNSRHHPVTFDETAIFGLLELAQGNIIHFLQQVMLPSMLIDRDDANRRYDETRFWYRFDQGRPLIFVSWDGSMTGLGRERNMAIRRLAYRAGIPEVPAGSGGYQFIWSTIRGILEQFLIQVLTYKEHHRYYHHTVRPLHCTWEYIEYYVAETRDSETFYCRRGLEHLKYKKVFLDNQEFEDRPSDDDGSVISFDLDDDEETGETFIWWQKESDVDLYYDSDESESHAFYDDEEMDDAGSDDGNDEACMEHLVDQLENL